MTVGKILSLMAVLLAVACCESEGKLKGKASNIDRDKLQGILGEPINDASKLPKILGVKRTTTIHKICLKLQELSKRTKNSNDKLIKQRCGVLSQRDQQYDKQAKKVAGIIQNGHNSKATWKEQREQLVREVNRLAKLAGPLPSLKSLKMAG